MKAAKLPDYFTKALPEPLKHDDVMVGLGGNIPVIPLSGVHPDSVFAKGRYQGINYKIVNSTGTSFTTNNLISTHINPLETIPAGSYGNAYELGTSVAQPQTITQVSGTLIPSNLYALGELATGFSVNNLRMAIQLQRFYELQARSGSRYIETLASIFGVKSSDARLQRPEYLGGRRYPIVMSQVLSNAEGNNTRIGSVGGMSQTVINDYLCTKSFEEHGTLMVLGVVRQLTHTYQQGCPKMLLRKNQFDFYNRALDHIGETAVLNQEIYAQGPSAINASTGKKYDEEVFGYQPAFEDMRLGWKYVTGEMRSNVQNSLDVWNYADDYNALPTLSSSWIDETEVNVDRTLSVTSSTSNQIFADFCFNTVYTRGMSAYGTPGFMDHM